MLACGTPKVAAGQVCLGNSGGKHSGLGGGLLVSLNKVLANRPEPQQGKQLAIDTAYDAGGELLTLNGDVVMERILILNPAGMSSAEEAEPGDLREDVSIIQVKTRKSTPLISNIFFHFRSHGVGTVHCLILYVLRCIYVHTDRHKCRS